MTNYSIHSLLPLLLLPAYFLYWRWQHWEPHNCHYFLINSLSLVATNSLLIAPVFCIVLLFNLRLIYCPDPLTWHNDLRCRRRRLFTLYTNRYSSLLKAVDWPLTANNMLLPPVPFLCTPFVCARCGFVCCKAQARESSQSSNQYPAHSLIVLCVAVAATAARLLYYIVRQLIKECQSDVVIISKLTAAHHRRTRRTLFVTMICCGDLQSWDFGLPFRALI